MPVSWTKRFTTTENAARRLLAVNTHLFCARSLTFLPISRAQIVLDGLNGYQTIFTNSADEFCADYQQILDRLKEEVGESQFMLLQTRLPPQNRIRSLFRFTWAELPLATGHLSLQKRERILHLLNEICNIAHSNNRISSCAAEIKTIVETAAFRGGDQVIHEETRALLQQARSYMQSQAERVVAEMSEEPRRVLVEIADKMLTSLTEGRVLRTVERIQHAFEMVKAFSFVNDNELIERINQVGDLLETYTLTEINTGLVGNRLADGLREVRDFAVDETRASAAVKNFRRIHI